jgi:two-component system, sensor histidine kinase
VPKSHKGTRPRGAPSLSSRPLIAAIDNDRNARFALVITLQDWGYDIVEGETAQAVIAALDSRPLAAVVTDYHLDHGDTGVQAALALSQHAGRDLPTLVITGSFGRKAEQEAEPQGFRVLTKPVDPELLRQIVSALVAQGP